MSGIGIQWVHFAPEWFHAFLGRFRLRPRLPAKSRNIIAATEQCCGLPTITYSLMGAVRIGLQYISAIGLLMIQSLFAY